MNSKDIDEIKEYLSFSIDHIYRMQGIPKESRKMFVTVVNNLLEDYKQNKVLQ